MEASYGLYAGNKIPLPQSIGKSPILGVRVTDIILSNEHPLWEKYGGWDALGVIFFTPFYGDLKDENNPNNYAKPFFSNIKNYPLIGEITYIIQLPDPSLSDNLNFSWNYYLNSINLWNHPHHNAFPKIDFSNLPEHTKLDYREIESGLVRKELDKDNNNFKFGNTFKEKSNIKPLLPFEGDIIYEGRWGQSIRLGSTVKDKNSWSINDDNEGNPITIIRNGQGDKNGKGWVPTLEDINLDASSFYITQGQTIPIKVASLNFKTFESILQESIPPIITIVDTPTPAVHEFNNSTSSSLQENIPSSSFNSQVSSSLFTSSSQEDKIYTEDDLNFSFPGEEHVTFIFNTDNIDEESSNIQNQPEKYNATIMSNESTQTKNDKGEYILWENGKITGYTPVVFINQIRVASKYEPFINILLNAAKKDNIPLRINSSLRTYDEQLALRKQNLKDKTKINDMSILTTAPSSDFNPQTGKPGFSNHQNGRAFDLNSGTPSVYKWLKENGIKYGFIRTVLTEQWHWEYLPGKTQYAYVPSDHTTWKV